MLKIEFEPPIVDPQPCVCCGGKTTRLTRLVYRDGVAYAAYYAQFSQHHPNHHHVSLYISIGEWAEDAPPSRRCSFYLHLWSDGTQYQFSVRDAAESPWGQVEIFGTTIDREDALVHPKINEVFQLADHILSADIPIREYLRQRS